MHLKKIKKIPSIAFINCHNGILVLRINISNRFINGQRYNLVKISPRLHLRKVEHINTHELSVTITH